MSTITELKQLIDDLIDTNESNFSSPRKIRALNRAQDKIVNQILKKDRLFQYDDNNYGDLAEGTINIVSGQKDYDISQDENLADLLFISKIYIIPSATDTEYYQIPLEKKGIMLDSDEVGRPDSYRITGKRIILGPVPNYSVNDGIKLGFIRKPKPIALTDTTRSPGLPPTYHYLLALYAAYDYARAKNMTSANGILSEIVQAEQELGIYIDKLNNDTNGRLEAENIDNIIQ